MRVMASAANVPKAVAKVALTKAMRRLSRAASMICSFSQSAPYQRSEKPVQTDTSRESLKE